MKTIAVIDRLSGYILGVAPLERTNGQSVLAAAETALNRDQPHRQWTWTLELCAPDDPRVQFDVHEMPFGMTPPTPDVYEEKDVFGSVNCGFQWASLRERA